MYRINNKWPGAAALQYENIPIWPLGSLLPGSNNREKINIK